jgi:hypothetical protein
MNGAALEGQVIALFSIMRHNSVNGYRTKLFCLPDIHIFKGFVAHCTLQNKNAHFSDFLTVSG